MKTCPDCNGDGVVDKGTDDEQRCPTCGGNGFVPDNDEGDDNVLNTSHLVRPTNPRARSAASMKKPRREAGAKKLGKLEAPLLDHCGGPGSSGDQLSPRRRRVSSAVSGRTLRCLPP